MTPEKRATGAMRGNPPRVLIVARGFPPASDPTSYRWLRFAGGLLRNGWQVEVLTTRPVPQFEYFDPRLAERIPKEAVVHRAYPGFYQPSIARARLERARAVPRPEAQGAAAPRPARAPRALLRHLDERLQSLKIPDPTFEWIVPGVVLGLGVLARRRFDLIVSSGAPFSSHVVGHQLHAWTRVPWVADFSDPFAENPFVQRPGWRRRVDELLEASWFRGLDGVIVPIAEMKAFFLRRHPAMRPDSIHVVSYGFDEELYATASPRAFEGFTLVHTGTFYAGLRDPGPFLHALAAVRDLPIHVVHAGVLQPEWVRLLDGLGIADRFEVLGLVSRPEVCSLQLGGSCLLLIGNRGGLQLPGKVLDYLGAQRPILALENDTNDIAARLVREIGAGLVIPNETEAIAGGLRRLFEWWRDGTLRGRYAHDGARQFAWTNLEDLLDRSLRGHLRAERRAAAAAEAAGRRA